MSGQLGKSLEAPGPRYRRRLTTRCGSRGSIGAGGAHGVRKLLPFLVRASDLPRWAHGALLLHGIVQVRDGEAQVRELIRVHPNAHLFRVPGVSQVTNFGIADYAPDLQRVRSCRERSASSPVLWHADINVERIDSRKFGTDLQANVLCGVTRRTPPRTLLGSILRCSLQLRG